MPDFEATFDVNPPSVEAEFDLAPLKVDAEFVIDAQVYKTSQLINDSDFQNAEQVQEAIAAAGISIEGSDLIEVVHTSTNTYITSKTYTFTQAIAADTWVIQHNLNKRPSITVVDSAGSSQIPNEKNYIDDNNVEISFLAPFAGKAYLN